MYGCGSVVMVSWTHSRYSSKIVSMSRWLPFSPANPLVDARGRTPDDQPTTDWTGDDRIFS